MGSTLLLISGNLESIEPHIHYFKNRLEHHLNASLLQTTNLKNGREINENSLKLHAGCSSDIYQLLLHKSSLLEDLAENKYDFDHNQYRRKKELCLWGCPDGLQAYQFLNHRRSHQQRINKGIISMGSGLV